MGIRLLTNQSVCRFHTKSLILANVILLKQWKCALPLMHCTFTTPLTLPALFVGLQLVTPRLDHLPGCTRQPNTEEHKNSIHLHGSHSPEDEPLLSVRIYSPPGLGALCLPETFPSPASEPIRGEKNSSSSSSSYTGLFYGLSGKHPTVLNLHSGKSNFD